MASMWWAQDNAPTPVKPNSELEDLFVFGYACKLFRDDDRAANIDRGKHLIPWMGDDRLLIDRYDGRGHLYDLSAYDADNINVEEIELSETEKAVESACDEERYLELRTDIAEAELYQEEEWKRYYESLHDGYKAVGFSYNQGQDDDSLSQEQQSTEDAEENKPYVPLAELQLPKGINMPPTKKVYAIMEKTGKFIAEHGTQMEIIIKAKQSGNGQFDFMHFEDRLYQFYKHLIKMIKSGKFKPKPTEVEKQDSHEDDDDQHGYLHPLLSVNNTTQPIKKPVPIPVVAIHKTCYGQLINSIRKHSSQTEICFTPQKDDSNTTPVAGSPLPPFVSEPAFDPAHPGLPAPPGTEPVVLPNPELPQLLGGEMNGTYRQDVEGGASLPPDSIVPPPPDIQPIIDRMAMYVAKNGVEFEIVVKSKTDNRFQFLHSHHVHFPYYDFKKQLFLKEVEQERLEKDEEAAAAANKSVSFSIKTRPKEPETSVTQLKKPLFDYGSSDDENEVESDGRQEKTTDVATSSSPTASDSGQVLDDMTEDKPLVRSDIPVDVLEKKMAEERLKDRLANAAREKLAQASKEKQVQAERKRKAAMFINLLKTKPTTVEETLDNGIPCIINYNHGKSIQSSASDTDPSHEKVLPRSEHERYESYRRGCQRSRSRSPRVGYRSRSRSPRIRYRSRSKSPLYMWRRRRSPTPPSAFCVSRRSRSRSQGRRVSPTRMGNGRRRSRSPRRAMPLVRMSSSRRSRSPKRLNKSPSRKRSRSREKKRKSPSKSSKRSRSRTPSSKHKKSKKLETKSPKKKKKDKDRDKIRDKRRDRSNDKSKDKEKRKSKLRSDKVASSDTNTNKSDVKVMNNGRRSKPENDDKSRDTSSDSGGDVSPRMLPSRVLDLDPVEIIEIDDDNDPLDFVVATPVPPSPVPVQPQGDKTQSPRIVVEGEFTDNSSGRGSPSVDPSRPPVEVPKHLMSRVRALLKASRDETLKEDGLGNS